MTLKCLSEGSQGPIVGYLQDVLRRAEYLNTQPTYAFDEQTKTAVQQFQKQLGLEPDGIVGAEKMCIRDSANAEPSGRHPHRNC